MKKPSTFVLAVLLGCLIGMPATGQGIVTGTLKDTLNNRGLGKASVVILRASDSVIQTFTWTDSGGRFATQQIPKGQYIVVASQAGYADFSSGLTVGENQGPLRLNDVVLRTKINLLQEVVVRQKIAAIRMHGDTTEYKADSFRVEKNATAEELLRKLPGLSVDRSGSITAYGQKVKRFLVDGEEFFGYDPVLTTRSIKAAMVDKVQVYDREASVVSSATGTVVAKEKTINLQLKGEARNGQFGTVHAGVGTTGSFENQLMYNYFKGRSKLAAYGIWNNTGITGLEQTDLDKYGIKEAMAATLQNDLSGWSGNYEGRGLPTVRTGGLQYSDHWGEKCSINANVTTSRIGIKGEGRDVSEYVLPDGRNHFRQNQRFQNVNSKNQGSVQLRYKLDSATTVSGLIDVYSSRKNTDNVFASETRNDSGALLNEGSRKITTGDDGAQVFARAGIEHRGRKPGRGLYFEATGAVNAMRENALVESQVLTFGQQTDSTVIQFNRKTRADFRRFGMQAKLSEPLNSKTVLVVAYDFGNDNNRSIIETFHKDPSGKYSLWDSALSSDYRFRRTLHQVSAFANYSGRKILSSVGAAINSQRFNQDDSGNARPLTRNFLSLNPKAELVYLISPQKKINLYYTGNLLPPSLFQLQPVVNNVDPLNVYTGNPGLQPGYGHTVGAGFNRYNAGNQSYIFSNVNFYTENNKISTAVHVDSAGRNTYRFVNVDGYQKWWGYLGIGKQFSHAANGGLNFTANREKNVSYINDKKNDLNSTTVDVEGYFNLAKEKIFQTGIRLKSTYFRNTASATPITAGYSRYWLHEINPSVDLFLPFNLRIHGDGNLLIRPKSRDVVFPPDAAILNGWVGKSFLDNALWIRISCHDILNQNTGYSSYASGNVITQSSFSVIKRYGLLSATWDFSKTLARKPPVKN